MNEIEIASSMLLLRGALALLFALAALYALWRSIRILRKDSSAEASEGTLKVDREHVDFSWKGRGATLLAGAVIFLIAAYLIAPKGLEIISARSEDGESLSIRTHSSEEAVLASALAKLSSDRNVLDSKLAQLLRAETTQRALFGGEERSLAAAIVEESTRLEGEAREVLGTALVEQQAGAGAKLSELIEFAQATRGEAHEFLEKPRSSAEPEDEADG